MQAGSSFWIISLAARGLLLFAHLNDAVLTDAGAQAAAVALVRVDHRTVFGVGDRTFIKLDLASVCQDCIDNFFRSILSIFILCRHFFGCPVRDFICFSIGITDHSITLETSAVQSVVFRCTRYNVKCTFIIFSSGIRFFGGRFQCTSACQINIFILPLLCPVQTCINVFVI